MTAKTSTPASVQKSNIGQLYLRPNPGDDILAVIYLQAKTEKLLGAFFWETAPSLKAFLDWCNRPDAVVVACYCGEYIAGLGVVSSIKTRCGLKIADASELFFHKYQGADTTTGLTWLLLQYAFEDLEIDTLFGTTPAGNLAALRFLKLMGFSHSATIPNLCCWMGEPSGGIVSWRTKEDWTKNQT